MSMICRFGNLKHYLLKAHDYAAGAAGHLSQNSLKRSYGAVTKSRRRNPNTSHIAPPLHLNQMIEGINKMFPDMKLSINRYEMLSVNDTWLCQLQI